MIFSTEKKSAEIDGLMRTNKSENSTCRVISGVISIWNLYGWTVRTELADRTVWEIQSFVNSARETSLTDPWQLTQLALNSRY